MFCGDDDVLIEIRTGEIYAGHPGRKKLRIVQEWLSEGKRRELTELNFYELNPCLKPQDASIDKLKRKSKKRKGK